MATEVLKSFGTLQSELEQAKSSLKGVDENIKRLIGRDPSELITPGQRHVKRPNVPNNEEPNPGKHRWGLGGGRRVYTHAHDTDEPPAKRRGGVFNRLSDRVNERVSHQDEGNGDFKGHLGGHRQMISKVIVTPKEVPSRQDALDAQSGDEQFKARNRRMFGALLGTLQKFQLEETKLKPKEEKRAQLEKKIEEIEIREKAEIKKERQELFQNRKKKQAEIKMIELKMQKMKTYAQWEELQKARMNFIQTNSKPSIHYLPKRMNDANKSALEETKKNIQKMIDERKQEISEEIQVIEEKMKWHQKKTQIQNTENDNADNDMDSEKDSEADDEHNNVHEAVIKEDEEMHNEENIESANTEKSDEAIITNTDSEMHEDESESNKYKNATKQENQEYD